MTVQRAFTLKELVENITAQTESLLNVLKSGIFVRADDQMRAIVKYCESVVPNLAILRPAPGNPLETVVARRCYTAQSHPQATNETLK